MLLQGETNNRVLEIIANKCVLLLLKRFIGYISFHCVVDTAFIPVKGWVVFPSMFLAKYSGQELGVSFSDCRLNTAGSEHL